MLASANTLFEFQTLGILFADIIHRHSDKNHIAHPPSVQQDDLQQGYFRSTHLGKIYICYSAMSAKFRYRNFNQSSVIDIHGVAHLSNRMSALQVLTQLFTNSGILGIPPSSINTNKIYRYIGGM